MAEATSRGASERGRLPMGRSCVCWQVEGALYPDMTASAIDGFYFAVATLTTVGYGDMGPQTTASRLFALFYALACGVWPPHSDWGSAIIGPQRLRGAAIG